METRDARYRELVRREAIHWGAEARRDPRHPQIWDDPRLQEIFFGEAERRFLERAVACGPRALELGCGDGDLAETLARRGLEVTGVDLAEARVREARARVAGMANAPAFAVGDLNTMALPGGPYDVVVAHDALHHLLDLDHVMREVARVLRPGGTLLVFDFIGMARPARLLAAAAFALLPTAMPYRDKWALRRRAGAFLASERAKREALERGAGEALHEGSPFEGVSQESIVTAVERRFAEVEARTFLPFFWYLAPKLRMPERMRVPMARRFRRWDDALLRAVRGAYVTIEARAPR